MMTLPWSSVGISPSCATKAWPSLNTVISLMGSLPKVLKGAAFSAAKAAGINTCAKASADVRKQLFDPIFMPQRVASGTAQVVRRT